MCRAPGQSVRTMFCGSRNTCSVSAAQMVPLCSGTMVPWSRHKPFRERRPAFREHGTIVPRVRHLCSAGPAPSVPWSRHHGSAVTAPWFREGKNQNFSRMHFRCIGTWFFTLGIKVLFITKIGSGSSAGAVPARHCAPFYCPRFHM